MMSGTQIFILTLATIIGIYSIFDRICQAIVDIKKKDFFFDLLPSTDYIDFHITEEQVEKICKHFNMDKNELEDTEIRVMLDRIIDNLGG